MVTPLTGDFDHAPAPGGAKLLFAVGAFKILVGFTRGKLLPFPLEEPRYGAPYPEESLILSLPGGNILGKYAEHGVNIQGVRGEEKDPGE